MQFANHAFTKEETKLPKVKMLIKISVHVHT